jgi:hypothetical protein
MGTPLRFMPIYPHLPRHSLRLINTRRFPHQLQSNRRRTYHGTLAKFILNLTAPQS